MPTHINTYADYLEATPNDRLTFEACGKLLDQLVTQMDLTDELYVETWQDFMHEAIAYTRIRADFAFMPITESSLQADKRTAAHNSVISTLSALARLMARDGRAITWATQLGIDVTDENVAKAKLNRRRIGDFANYLTYINALSSRLV